MVNLVVDLDEKRFGADALAGAMRGIETAGYEAEVIPGYPKFTAWIDDVFGGTWSSEAHASRNVVASRVGDVRYAGFASFDPIFGDEPLRFRWLRGLATEPAVGIFGPFGVAPEHRGSGIGPHLLIAALAGLRKRGYSRALVPAVGAEKLVEYYARYSGARVAETFDKAAFQAHRYRTVVLASGNGTHFQTVLDASKSGTLPLDIVAMICNRADAPVRARARAGGFRDVVLPWDRASETRAAYDALVLQTASGEEPELVLLLGWMHLFDEAFVREFGDRAVNIHPAYLPLDQSEAMVQFPDGSESPAFRGAHAIQDALAHGGGWTGATSHALSLGADRGRVLVRKPLRLPEGADLASAIDLLRPVEQKVVAGGIMRWVYER